MRSDDGFSLVEALVAATIMAAGLSTLAHLYVVALSANDRARSHTRATFAAQQKMEDLLAGGPLASSPPGAIDGNVPGWFDFVDQRGRSLGGGPGRPAAAMSTRRWSVEPMTAAPEDLLVVHVRVLGVRPGGGDLRLVGVRAVSGLMR